MSERWEMLTKDKNLLLPSLFSGFCCLLILASFVCAALRKLAAICRKIEMVWGELRERAMFLAR
jgi:hypothetical protein